MKYFVVLAMVLCYGNSIAQGTQSPSEFLGYELGERFSFHHHVVDYFEHIAENEPGVVLKGYGETYEYRPLMVAFVSTPANISRLEEIRTDNLKRAGMLEGQPTGDKIAIVWLSYNVHGNEANSTEASMATLYELVKKDGAYGDWLENTVVVIDPCINPDGRDRYSNWYRQVGHKVPNPNIESSEHKEPWPEGRVNHYLYDLNRDWAWQTQVESQGRMALYNQWLPHVHVDFHEMFRNNPYYFAPAAEPYHEVITPWQRDFQNRIGKNHAKYFDKEGWLYYTKENFDLFYPSYGDSYPTFSGAIGMTFEQAGHGKAGLAVVTENEDTLTLLDRLTHHTTAGLSTIETSVVNRERLIDEFENFFTKSKNNPTGPYLSFIVKEKNSDKLKQLIRLLDNNGIDYAKPGAGKRISGFHYQSNREKSFQTESTDLLISMYQPKSNLVKVLFEPEARLKDSLTYDITAWSIPYAYDLNTYAVKSKIDPAGEYELILGEGSETAEKPYAFISKWESIADVKFLSHLIKEGVKARYAEKDFILEGTTYKAGSIIITRRENEHLGNNFSQKVKEIAIQNERKISSVSTGFVEQGKDLGSESVKFIGKPRVGVLSGEETSKHSYGQLWYYFEQEIEYPFDALNSEYFKTVDLHKYNVLIIPRGDYKLFDEDSLKRIHAWVEKGGRLVLIQEAISKFAGKTGFGILESKKSEVDQKNLNYKDKDAEQISDQSTGSILQVKLDNSHPLAFGYPEHYFTLKNNALRYPMLEKGWNVGVITDPSAHRSGFIGHKLHSKMQNVMVFGVEEIGEGRVVYLTDNVLFRSFWNNGKLIISNAVFFRL